MEKYENKLLADWVNEVPKMFCNEMDGFDWQFITSL